MVSQSLRRRSNSHRRRRRHDDGCDFPQTLCFSVFKKGGYLGCLGCLGCLGWSVLGGLCNTMTTTATSDDDDAPIEVTFPPSTNRTIPPRTQKEIHRIDWGLGDSVHRVARVCG